MKAPSHQDTLQANELDELRAQLAMERAARLRAESADAAKDAFVARLGHEWRTPLGAIAAAADVLEGIASTDEPLAREARDVIRRQAGQLARRIDTLLDATRVIGGQVELMRWRVDLADVARQAVATADAAGLAAHCELRLTSHEVLVDIDPERVEQAIAQLLSNALRSTPAGGEVEVEAGEDARGAFVRVRDGGPGLDPAELARLFGPRPALAIDALRPFGTPPVPGIGVRFVTALMAALGGRCEVDSSHRGTSVTLRFAASPSPDRAAAAAPVPARVLQVLLIDDGALTEPLRQWLVAAGHAVTTARSLHALEPVAALRPELTFVAVGSSADGAELHEDMLALARAARGAGYGGRMVAVLGATVPAADGGDDGPVARRLRVAGFDAQLAMPFDAVALRGEIARV